ncbi:MAG: 3-phosphoglycerate dehydrogenase [Rhodospirillaceae bacterium]|nr:3-phosphoglycerate dehydrogenase [Rhodospirillaceae bacterium]
MSIKFIDCPVFLSKFYVGKLSKIVPDLEINTGELVPSEMLRLVEHCEFVMNDHTYMDPEFLAHCKRLKSIVFMGTGASSFIDIPAAKSQGIRVRTIKGYGDRSVAEHAIALMFSAGRRVVEMDRSIRQGEWATLNSMEFRGKRLGVVGTGGIGSEVVKMGAALGLEVLAWNRSGVPNNLPCKEVTLDYLMGNADVLSLHLALTDETKGILDAGRLEMLRSDVILVNTSRGALINEDALLDCLRDHRIRHAALDVFSEEPLSKDSPFLELENVTLTAHAGWMTTEASINLFRMSLEELSREILNQA